MLEAYSMGIYEFCEHIQTLISLGAYSMGVDWTVGVRGVGGGGYMGTHTTWELQACNVAIERELC